jgi:hypothetical protein
MTELQRKHSESSRQVEERSARIAELCDKDLGKNLEILQTESKILDRQSSEKRCELSDLQKYAGSLY